MIGARQDWRRVVAQVVLLVTIAALAFVGLKVIDVFFPGPKVNGPKYFWLYPACLLLVLYSIIRSKKCTPISSIIIFFLLLEVTWSGFYFYITPWIESWKVKTFSAHYKECRDLAVSANNKVSLRLCEAFDRGAYFDGIAYDSSDEISLGTYQRSSAWWQEVRSRNANDMFMMFAFDATPLGANFYYVKFDPSSSSPDLTCFNKEKGCHVN